MATQSPSLARYALAIALIVTTALFVDVPPSVFASTPEGNDDVTVAVSVEGQCEGQESPVAFLPYEENALGTLSEGGGAQTANINLSITSGVDSSCNDIYGYVDFTETGFSDPMLDWSFFCDGAEISASGGVYTCASGDGLSSPTYVDLDVSALTGATLGEAVDANTISFTLYAEPTQ